MLCLFYLLDVSILSVWIPLRLSVIDTFGGPVDLLRPSALRLNCRNIDSRLSSIFVDMVN